MIINQTIFIFNLKKYEKMFNMKIVWFSRLSLEIGLFFFKIQIITFTQILPFLPGETVLGHAVYNENLNPMLLGHTIYFFQYPNIIVSFLSKPCGA
jgi:hypothetical protein